MATALPDRLLQIDSVAGLSAGVVMLAASPWVAGWYAVPRAWLVANAAANLLYGTASGLLARRRQRPVTLVATMALANLAWAVGCVALLVVLRDRASWLGLGHLAVEALFVGGLGALEWRHRHRLGNAP
jgi:hypothetical protein